jgi:two-component system, OmpR family, phosphate regulon sensor histidine kinase PhoR
LKLKLVRAKLFWKLGLTYLALLVLALFALDFYATRVFRSDALRAVDDQLASVESAARAHPPDVQNPAALQEWVQSTSGSGARVTVVASDGTVLADSAADPAKMENHANRPEVQAAIANGAGKDVRQSATLGRALVYRAYRFESPSGAPVVIRFALPLAQVNESIAEFRRRLLLASLVMLILGGVASLIYSRGFSARIERLKDFSHRVASGDFRPLPSDDTEDELTDLARALNETAAHLDLTIRTLTGERNQSSAILRSMIEGVAVIDSKERVVFCNRAFAEILNIDAARCEGRPLVELVRQADLLDLARRALTSADSLQGSLIIGTVMPRSFAVTATPIKALEPAANGAVIVLHDITELRRLERVRQDFVANVSHEFKTPLTAIQGFAETLLGGALEDEKNNRRFLEIIRDHAARLGRLTDDLLKLARIEAGKLEIQYQPVSVAELVEGCAATTLFKASQRNIALNLSYPPELPAVRGDAGLLREVLQNLLDNAVQYTSPGGRVDLSAATRDHEAVITVADTGIGIPLADQERIFERFYRVDAARSREVGGTGLGLSIAKHIVEAHGGRLWVESTVGAGSRFHFSIPLAS